MAILPNREKLKEKLADSVTSPDFGALSAIDPASDGNYLSLEARIDTKQNGRREPVKLELQRYIHNEEGEDYLEYTLTKGGVRYSGKVDIVEDGDRFLARVSLDKINGKRVFTQEDKKGRENFAYRKNGEIAILPKEKIKCINYWVPTIINHMNQNADYFLQSLMEGPAAGSEKGDEDKYRLVVDGEGTPKSPHFRNSCTRSYFIPDGSGGEMEMTVEVTGTFVKTDWTGRSTESVLEDIAGHANEISPLHFEGNILKEIAAAGHSYKDVLRAYNSTRTDKE